MRYIIMFLSCLFVLGTMAAVLSWFFRRLRRIEAARWGDR